ncbi:Zinc-binding protein A33 [Merluccius polli]|uniref:Zinc-binding protein A33 n=1 Tax=Merluccius polli TaxID=89951 RepID=A0AA47M1R3_MERPO|nr:Zinc-binding protein A33 [Merluccius polli]
MDEIMDVSGDRLPTLEENLTCPVCRDVFRDPVLLTCSHSFCRGCLEQSWRSKDRTCPVCRAVFKEDQPTANRALSDTCEVFLKDKQWQNRDRPDKDSLCRLHGLGFQLYCMKDEELLCVECVKQHQYHEVCPLQGGLSYCKEQLGFKINILENRLKLYKNNKKAFTSTKEHIEHQGGEAAEILKAEFVRLHKVLEAEQEVRLKALVDEEREKKGTMEAMVAQASEGIAALSKLVQQLKREMGDEDMRFLQANAIVLCSRSHASTQWPHEELQHPPGALLDMGKHVGSLGFNIWKNMQAHVQYNPVVLDPNTASPWLDLTPDLTSMKESQQRQAVPDNPERFDPCVFLLGSMGFSEGKHRWDVVVGDNPKWIVGVCTESLARKKKFTVSPKRGVWSLALSKGVLTALSVEPTKVQVETRVEKVRVKLNMDKGEVSFWDGESLMHLCTFNHKFNEKMFPLFGPGLHSTPMVLAPGKMVVHT